MKYASEQPKDGDTILHCGHLNAKNHHFAKSAGEATTFVRPDGTTGRAYWRVACEHCFYKYGKNMAAVPIRGDGTWLGNDPIIKTPDEITKQGKAIEPFWAALCFDGKHDYVIAAFGRSREEVDVKARERMPGTKSYFYWNFMADFDMNVNRLQNWLARSGIPKAERTSGDDS